MNTAIQCIVLLACTVICNSTPILKCLCLTTSNSVNLSLIADVKEYMPRPYCNEKEVIVILKDKNSQCLNPKLKFTQAVLRTIKKQRVATKMNTTSPKTTTASATVSTTLSK